MTQASCKEGEVSESSGSTECLPLLADLVLYYCRHADQPVLVQLYQVEVRGAPHTVSHLSKCATVSRGSLTHSVSFLFCRAHSWRWLEETGGGRCLFTLWSWGTALEPELLRAWVSHTLTDIPRQPQHHTLARTHRHTQSNVYYMLFVGAASKRFGIEEEREAVPLTLSVAYNKVQFHNTNTTFHWNNIFNNTPTDGDIHSFLSYCWSNCPSSQVWCCFSQISTDIQFYSDQHSQQPPPDPPGFSSHSFLVLLHVLSHYLLRRLFFTSACPCSVWWTQWCQTAQRGLFSI